MESYRFIGGVWSRIRRRLCGNGRLGGDGWLQSKRKSISLATLQLSHGQGGTDQQKKTYCICRRRGRGGIRQG
jgi:hypothetical protein